METESAVTPELANRPHSDSQPRRNHGSPPAPLSVSDTAPDAGSEPFNEVPNPRKRKKASRACDFCHVNHQPCDNGRPRCSVCAKHDKACLYLRPTKRRGPQKGYRTALNSYKESAAAWGAVLTAIPGLDVLIEGHLVSHGSRIVKSIKDPEEQEALIAKWQQSSVYKAIFGDGTSTAADGADTDVRDLAGTWAARDEDDEDEELVVVEPSLVLHPPKRSSVSQSSSISAPVNNVRKAQVHASLLRGSSSLSDIVAKDAARSSLDASQILVPLGFAANETIADFYNIGCNPEPMTDPFEQELDPALAKAYYELGMGGRSLPA